MTLEIPNCILKTQTIYLLVICRLVIYRQKIACASKCSWHLKPKTELGLVNYLKASFKIYRRFRFQVYFAIEFKSMGVNNFSILTLN